MIKNNNMKKIFFLTWLIIPICVFSQENEKFKVSGGLFGGYGYNLNGYRFDNDIEGFSYYDINSNYTIGLNCGIFITPKFRPRIAFSYAETKYGSTWPAEYFVDKTEVTLYNIDMSLNLDYMLLSRNNLQLFISPGIITEFAKGEQYKNYLIDGSINYKKYNLFTEQYPTAIAGCNLALLARYNLNEYFSLTFSPNYTYFLKPFVSSNNKPYQRVGANFGVEFSF